MAQELHETKEHLIQATSDLLDEVAIEDLSAAMVLERAGASKSSMYHFFEDFSDLVEATLLRRFAASVETTVKAIHGIVDTSSDKESFFRSLEKITHATQARSQAVLRFRRARKLARSEGSERFMKALGQVQQELTDSLTLAFEKAQKKGFITVNFQARTLAVFIQAYTLGKIVDDVTTTQMDDGDWERLITTIAAKVIAAD